MTIYYDTKGLARRVNLSPRTLERFRVSGAGPSFIKLGKSIRYRVEDVDLWIEAQTRRSTSDNGSGAAD